MQKNENKQSRENPLQESDEKASQGKTPVPEDEALSPNLAFQEEATFQVTFSSLIYRYGFIAILTVIGALLIYLIAPTGRSSGDIIVLIILGIWILALLRYWIYLLDMPYRIRSKEDGLLEFISVFRKRKVPRASILSLKVSSLYPSYLREQERDALREISIQSGRKQSELIREAIDFFISRVSKTRRQTILDQASGMWKDRKDLPDFSDLRLEWDRDTQKK